MQPVLDYLCSGEKSKTQPAVFFISGKMREVSSEDRWGAEMTAL